METTGVLSKINQYSGNDVSQPHIDYLLHTEQIQLVQDIFNGTDTAIQYIFRFPQELEPSYNERKSRATLRNFVKRSVSAFIGMIFRKPIEYANYGPKLTQQFETIDSKNSIDYFTREIAEMVTRDGKTYILADSPKVGETSPIDYDKPYLMAIDRQSLINWRKDSYGTYKMIVIHEIIAEEKGSFGTEFVNQWRHYYIDTQTSKVHIDVYRKSVDKGVAFEVVDSIDTDFDKIPIVEIDVDDVPLMYDIAKMNIKYLNRQSHKDRYLTMAACPVPVIWGADIDKDSGAPTTAKPALVIGVDEAFIFNGTKEECDFEWRELTGTSIELIEEDLNSIVEDITTGILRASETANAVQKTATEVQLLQAEASNRVTVIASAVERGMNKALGLLGDINKESIPSNAFFTISKDFNSALMGSDGARVVLESYLLGLLSTDTFLKTLSEMELINITSATEEMDKIKADNFKPKAKRVSTSANGMTDNRTTSAINK
jgi:hypothetical protein